MAYTSIPLEDTFQDLVDDAVAYMTAASEGQWAPDRGAVETWLIEAWCRAVERVLRQVSTVTDDAFTTYGTQTVGLAQQTGTPATVASTWTMRTDAGHTIPAGALVALGADQHLFAVVDEVTVDQGNSATDPGEVTLQAITPGIAANGIPAGTAQRVDVDPQVLQVITTATTAGGIDPETAEEYRDRLTDYLRLALEAAVTAQDFATFARVFLPQVGRALAIANYDAANELADQPDHITLAVADDDGAALSSGDKELVTDLFDTGTRMVNAQVHVIDASYVPITIAYTGVAAPGADAATVETAADAAVAAHLHPSDWRTTGEDGNWDPDPVVRYLDIYGVLAAVPNLAAISSLTLNGGIVDVDLSSGDVLAPLPDATVNGTVS